MNKNTDRTFSRDPKQSANISPERESLVSGQNRDEPLW